MFLNKDLGANNIGSLDCRGHLVAFSSAKEFFSVKKKWKYKPVHKSRLAHMSKKKAHSACLPSFPDF